MREIVSPLSGIRSPFGARRNPLAAYRAGGFTPKLVAAFGDEFYAKEGRKSTFGGVLEPTATTNGTMVDSDGLLKWRPHNLLTDTVGLTTNWSLSSQGTGSLPTITRDYAAAPDGTMTAARLQCSRTSAAGGDRSYLQQATIPTVVGSEVTEALWVKSTDGTPQTIQLWNQQEANSKITETVGSSWQRISLEYPVLLSTAGKFWIGLVGSETSDLTTDVLIWHPHLHRSDLGGMASDPDQPAGFETEVPTTGSSAVYLPRRGHHIWNGSAWVNEGILTEPSTQTNKPHASYSAPKNGSTNVTGLTISDDAGVGFTGAGTGPRVTGSGSAGTQRMHLGVGDATYRSTAQVFIAKSSTHKYYQILSSASGGNGYANFDITDGSIGSVGSDWSADGIVNVVDHETFYELIVNDTVLTTGPRWLYFVDSKTASYAASSATSDYGDIPYIGNIHQSGADNTFPALPIICTGSQVARAGEQLPIPHENISWPAGDELSIHIQGRMTGQNSEFVRWRLDASNYIDLSSGTGDFTFAQSESGTVDSVTGGSFTSGTNVPFNVASRNGSTFINGAVDGTALTENTTPTTFPDLETTDLELAYSGGSMVIKEVSLWDVNIQDAGTEDATDD